MLHDLRCLWLLILQLAMLELPVSRGSDDHDVRMPDVARLRRYVHDGMLLLLRLVRVRVHVVLGRLREPIARLERPRGTLAHDETRKASPSASLDWRDVAS